MPQANPPRLLNAAGQSIWYDNIQRSMLTSGMLARLIAEDDLRGITSNPTIFEKAIAGSRDYDEALRRELQRNPQQSSRDLFFTLAIEDIRAAAEAAGLPFVHIPVRGGAMTPADIARFKAALAELPQPILGYCRSGTRTTFLWALSQAGERPAEEIVALAAAAGYDVSPLGPRLEG